MRVSSILAVSLSVIAVSAHDYDPECSSHLSASSPPAPLSTPKHQELVYESSAPPPTPSGNYSSQVQDVVQTTSPAPTPTPTPTGGDDGYGPPPAEEAQTTPIPTPTPTGGYGDNSAEEDCGCTASYAYTTVTQTICPASCYLPTTTPAATPASQTPLNPHYPPASSSMPPLVSTPVYPVETPLPTDISDYSNTTITGHPASSTPTNPAQYDGGAIANQPTLVGGALAAILCAVGYLL